MRLKSLQSDTCMDFQLNHVEVHHDCREGNLTLRRGHHEIRCIHPFALLIHHGKKHELSLLRNGVATVEKCGDFEVLTIHVDHGCIQSEWFIKVVEGDHFQRIGVRLFDPAETVHIELIRAFSVAWTNTPLAGELNLSRWWVFPSSAWDRPGTRPLLGPPTIEDTPSIAFDIAGAYAPSGKAITLGHILPSRWINRIDASDTKLEINSTVGVKISPYGSLTADDVLLDFERPITTALSAIGDRHQGRRRSAEANHHTGWNTWDYFTDKILEKDVTATVNFISSHSWLKSKVRYVVVDDAWQNLTGDWLPGDRFGSIHRSIDHITKAGYFPGIWTAPFMIDRHSDLMTKHPEYVLKFLNGEMYSHCMGCDPPWGDRFYLDPTHPGVVEHIFGLYRRLYEWGFRYFKTDFLTNSISPEFPGEDAKYAGQIKYHNSDLGLVRAHRICMEAIRAAIGPDSFWLGCGTHFASAAGLVDASRISSDMRVFFPSLLVCAKSAIFNFHIHGGPFLVDPDFAVFRGRDTSIERMLECPAEGTKSYNRNEPNTGPTFNLAEAQLWAAILIMSGGLIMLSDKLEGLNDKGLKVVRTLLDHAGGPAAVPLDIFESLPSVWQKQHRNFTYILIANWSEEMVNRPLSDACKPKPGIMLEDIWSGESFRCAQGMSLNLPAHGHRLLRWRNT